MVSVEYGLLFYKLEARHDVILRVYERHDVILRVYQNNHHVRQPVHVCQV